MVQKKYEQLVYRKKVLLPTQWKVQASILEEANFSTKLENYEITIFSKTFDFSDPDKIDWHKDFFSGHSYPKRFSKNINILANPNLSAKVVWEVNRLQFLTKIALNYKMSAKETHINLFIQIVKSWISANPYLTGINWYSNIEVNIRLINWFLCWELLEVEKLIKENDNFKEFVNKDWIPSIYQHCIYSFSNPSKYSSANNHLVSEYAGLFIASSKWKFPESEKWLKYSQKGLEMEIGKQHSISGINKEEAAEYIQFITDFFLLSYIVGERTEMHFSDNYKSNLKRIFNYIFDLLDMDYNFPNYGDNDEGKCFILDFDKDFNNFRSLLTSGVILFNDRRLKPKSNGFDLKNHILFGDSGKILFEALPTVATPEQSAFYKEGHFIFRKQEDEGEIYLHFDAAPLGFLSIAAHGHSDALSVILNVDGKPILVDVGTYTYHTENEWRNYFLSTLAHNTICIDGLNQAQQAGPTMWLKHYTIHDLKIEQNNEFEAASASHDGYKSIGCTHKRCVTFYKAENKFTIIDEIATNNIPHTIVQPWHLHPLVNIKTISEHSYLLIHRNSKRGIKITLDTKINTKIAQGEVTPILGWYSSAFMQKEKTSVIVGEIKSESSDIIKLTTTIEIL